MLTGKITIDKDRPLGKGGYGKVYFGQMDTYEEHAVKVRVR